MTIFVAFMTLYVIDWPGVVYYLNHCQPQVMNLKLKGSKSEVGIKSCRPLQSNITTALSITANATRMAAVCWTSKLLWQYAFMLMEKDEFTIAGFSKVVDGGIMTLLWPHDVAKRKNVFLIYLIIFTCFRIIFHLS